MGTAVVDGLLASSSFAVGALAGLFTSPPLRLLASIIAFGAGVLVSALSFDLMGEAFEKGTASFAITGFLLGALIYVVTDVALERLAARSPKRTGRDPDAGGGPLARLHPRGVERRGGRLHAGHPRRLRPA